MSLLARLSLDHCYLVITPVSAGVTVGLPGQAGLNAFRARVPELVCAVDYHQLLRCTQEDLNQPVLTSGPSRFVVVSPDGHAQVAATVEAMGSPATSGLPLDKALQVLAQCRSQVDAGALVMPSRGKRKR